MPPEFEEARAAHDGPVHPHPRLRYDRPTRHQGHPGERYPEKVDYDHGDAEHRTGDQVSPPARGRTQHVIYEHSRAYEAEHAEANIDLARSAHAHAIRIRVPRPTEADRWRVDELQTCHSRSVG